MLAVSTMSMAQVKHGAEMRLWIEDTPVCIYLPYNYFEVPTRFPVLYLLHGTGGNEMSWFADGDLVNTIETMISNGSCVPMVVVMPEVTPEMDGTFEIKFDKIRTSVEEYFKVSRLRVNHAIAGLSMGGFYAMHISHFYPKEFDYVGLFSPIYTTKKMEIFDKKMESLFGIDALSPEVYKNVESDLKKQFSHNPSLYYIAIGKYDFLYNQNVLYRRYLDEHNYKYVYKESGGGHEWKNWKKYIVDFLPQLFRKNTPLTESFPVIPETM